MASNMQSDVFGIARASRAFEPNEPGSTRDMLITAAERLFAERGIEGVSLRTISVESKQANTRALQYHFNDRAGIVSAILLTRMVYIEQRRSELLEEALRRGHPDIMTLLEILMRPISEFASDDGRNLHARFLSHVASHTYGWSFETFPTDVSIEGPTGTERAHELLLAQLPLLDADRMQARLSHILRMFLGAIVARENTLVDGGQDASLEDTIREQFVMGAAAILAPVIEHAGHSPPC